MTGTIALEVPSPEELNWRDIEGRYVEALFACADADKHIVQVVTRLELDQPRTALAYAKEAHALLRFALSALDLETLGTIYPGTRLPDCHRCGDTGKTSIGDGEVWCECPMGKRLSAIPW